MPPLCFSPRKEGQKKGETKMKHYNLDEIKTAIRKGIAINTAFAEAWEKVSFPTKKDGKPFAVMSKNIEGAKYSLEQYAMQAGEYELTVYTFSPAAGYIHDTVKAYELVKYLKDEAKKAKTANYQPEQSYLEQVYTFDLEDIKEAVKARAAYLREYVADLERQLADVDSIFHGFRDAFAAAMKQLEDSTAHHSHKDTFYAVRDTVLNRFPYC